MLCLSMCLSLVTSCPIQENLPLRPGIFRTQVAVEPYSTLNALAVGPNRRFIYSGEGGGLAIIDTNDPEGFQNALRVPIGPGVRPAELVVDGGTDVAAATDDVLLIAGGRSGFWVMEAHPTSELRAARVDDAVGLLPTRQQSRRWCVDVGVFSIRESAVISTEYVAVLFSAKNGSRLRIYKMRDVRDVLFTHPEETGNEIAAELQVVLPGRPDAFQPTQPYQISNLLALGLDIDQAAPDRAAVYLALGAHGLARVSIFWSPQQQRIVTPGLELGPVFGDGTFYHDQPNGETYSNFQYKESPTAEIQREEPPLFMDVAVQNFGGGYYLYAAVDTLGWLRVSLDTAQDTWSPFMTIDHHEGEPVPLHPFDEIQFRLDDVPGTDQDYVYPRRLQILDLGAGQDPVLAVAGHCHPFITIEGHRSEGRVLGHDAGERSGVSAVFVGSSCGNGSGLISGIDAFTYFYRIDPGFPGIGLNAVARRDGNLAADQPPDPEFEVPYGGLDLELRRAPTSGEFYFYSQHGLSTSLSLAASASGPLTELGARLKQDRPGKDILSIGYSLVEPNVIVEGSNDGGLPSSGILTTCGDDIKVFYEPDPTTGSDPRSTNGILFHQDGQWDAGSGDHYMWGSGGGQKCRMTRFHPGTDFCDRSPTDPPDRVALYVVHPHHDRFDFPGRWYFQGTASAEYDAENDQGWPILFMSRTGSPDGVVVLDRTLLVEAVEGLPPGDDDIDLETELTSARLAALDTDPEFRNVDESHPDAHLLVSSNGLAGALNTFAPELLKVRGPGSVVRDTWILAVPCGFIDNGQRDGLQVYVDHPEWKVTASDAPFDETNFDHLLVQFWNVQDPAAISEQSELPPLVGMEDKGQAYIIEKAYIGARVFIFIADFGGRVLVYEITDILQGANDEPVHLATWTATESLTDDLPSNVYEIAVDQALMPRTNGDTDEIHVYAGVERVGMVVLRFLPDAVPGKRLREVELIQTPGNVRAIQLRKHKAQQHLILSDGAAGVRIFER